jgi:hypothetical protein
MKKVTLLMAGLLIFPRLLAAQAPDIDALLGENWYGLYMNGQKAGYSLNKVTRDDKKRIHVIEDAKFHVSMSGTKQDMHIFSDRCYAEDGRLIEIMSEVTDPAQMSRFHAVVSGEEMVLTSTVGGNDVEKTLPRPQESLMDSLRNAHWARQRPQVGDTVNFSVFEPLYQQEVSGISRIIDIGERVLNGVTTKVYKIRTAIDLMAIDSVSYVSEAGETLEEQIANSITMRLEQEEVAKDVTYSNDVIISNAAMVDTPIENPRTRPALRLALRGPLTDKLLFNDDRQRMFTDGDHVEFRSRTVPMEGFQAARLPVTDEKVLRHAKPTQFIQSDHAKLIAQAGEIAGDEKDMMAVSTKLCAWVYKNVRNIYSARLSNALEVLEHLEGDCTEHSVLFIGLARAAGLPAREVAGLVYIPGNPGGFYFHQWATVWVGQWIDVDPTFNQPQADVTHIKLVEGDLFQQARIIPVIGNLKIAVLPDATDDVFAKPAGEAPATAAATTETTAPAPAPTPPPGTPLPAPPSVSSAP